MQSRCVLNVCSPESGQGSPEGPAKDALDLEAQAQLASPASSRPQTLGGRSQASALAQLADVEGSSWGPRGASHAPSKYGSFSADLDFDEFLDRQQRFLQVCHLFGLTVIPLVYFIVSSWHKQCDMLTCEMATLVCLHGCSK